MSDQVKPEELAKENGWVKLYHPRGPHVTLPVTEKVGNYKAMLASVSAMLDAGWLVDAPGLEAGENKTAVKYVLRRNRESKDGDVPIVDLYGAEDNNKWKFLTVYLNRVEDVQAFEAASGLKLASLPLFVGLAAPQRGFSKQTDSMIVQAPKQFSVIWCDNPAHNPEEKDVTKMKPKRKFVRWDGVQAASQNGDGHSGDKPEPELANDWKEYLIGRLKVAKTIEEAQVTFAQMNSATKDLLKRHNMLDAVVAEKDAAKARFTVKV